MKGVIKKHNAQRPTVGVIRESPCLSSRHRRLSRCQVSGAVTVVAEKRLMLKRLIFWLILVLLCLRVEMYF